MAEGGVDGAGCIPLPVPENVRLLSDIAVLNYCFFIVARRQFRSLASGHRTDITVGG